MFEVDIVKEHAAQSEPREYPVAPFQDLVLINNVGVPAEVVTLHEVKR